MNYNTTQTELKAAFSRFGEVTNCNLIVNQDTGHSRCFGFITFNNIEDATEARAEMNGTKLDGYTVRVDYSVTRDPSKPRNYGALDSYIPRRRNDYYPNNRRGGGRGGGRDNFDRSRIQTVHHDGGSNPAVDKRTGRRENWMGGNSYRGGFLSSANRNYHANSTFTKEDFQALKNKESGEADTSKSVPDDQQSNASSPKSDMS